MKKIVVASLLFLATVPFAAAANVDVLRAYVVKALAKCPDQKLTIEPIDAPGPTGFPWS